MIYNNENDVIIKMYMLLKIIKKCIIIIRVIYNNKDDVIIKMYTYY